FDNNFVPGQDFNESYSPALDTRAKYLYLYQIANDRGITGMRNGLKFAKNDLEEDVGAGALDTLMIPLLVDPRYLTSWGHFKNEGFTIDVKEPKTDTELPAGGKTILEDKVLAVSANPSVVGKLPHKAYRPDSPAYKFQNLLGVGNPT